MDCLHTSKCDIADSLFFSKGTEKDIKEAVQYYMKEAEADNDYAQFMMGFIYEQFSDNNIDLFEKACEWYRKAALNGNRKAMYKIGALSVSGHDYEKSIGESLYYLNLAAENNIGIAQFLLTVIYRTLNEAWKCYTWEVKWRKNMNSFSYFELGYLYEKGYIVTRNEIKAKEFYEKSKDYAVFIKHWKNKFNFLPFINADLKNNVNKSRTFNIENDESDDDIRSIETKENIKQTEVVSNKLQDDAKNESQKNSDVDNNSSDACENINTVVKTASGRKISYDKLIYQHIQQIGRKKKSIAKLIFTRKALRIWRKIYKNKDVKPEYSESCCFIINQLQYPYFSFDVGFVNHAIRILKYYRSECSFTYNNRINKLLDDLSIYDLLLENEIIDNILAKELNFFPYQNELEDIMFRKEMETTWRELSQNTEELSFAQRKIAKEILSRINQENVSWADVTEGGKNILKNCRAYGHDFGVVLNKIIDGSANLIVT